MSLKVELEEGKVGVSYNPVLLLIAQLFDTLVRGTALMMALVGFSLSIASLGGAYSDMLDALTHIAPLCLVFGGIAIALGLVSGRGGERIVVVCLGVATLLASSLLMLPEYWAASKFRAQTPQAGDLKVLQFNAWRENTSPKKSLDWVVAQRADIVVVEEATRKAWPAVKRLKEIYPFASCARVRCTTWIFSRQPMIARGELFELDGAWATIADPRGAFTVVGVHHAWPLPAGEQRVQVSRLSSIVGRLGTEATIVAGDFNSTPWSFMLRRQDRMLGLKRWTRALASWPVGQFSPVIASPAPVLPIDHVYAGSEWMAVRVDRGPPLGSDHLPVVVSFRRR